MNWKSLQPKRIFKRASIGQNPGTGRTLVEWQGAGDSVIGADGGDGQLVQGAIAFGKRALRRDGLAHLLRQERCPLLRRSRQGKGAIRGRHSFA